MKPETVEKLKSIAKGEIHRYEEDFCAMDWSGGNFDDAWDGGMRDGQAEIAQMILEMEGIPYEI